MKMSTKYSVQYSERGKSRLIKRLFLSYGFEKYLLVSFAKYLFLVKNTFKQEKNTRSQTKNSMKYIIKCLYMLY